MTLIELLVVIVILTTIVGAAIPILSPANDDRRLREAARGLNTFITGTTRAIANRRPYGIVLKKLSQETGRDDPSDLQNDNGVCLEVFYAEQPPAYAGFDPNSRVCVGGHPEMPGFALVRFVTRGDTAVGLPPGWQADLFPSATIRPGDVVETGGTRFELLGETQDTGNYTEIETEDIGSVKYFNRGNPNVPAIILARPLNDSGQQINVKYNDAGREIGQLAEQQRPYWSSPAPYKILRQPTIASDQPYQLPEGAAIDLRASGLGDFDYFYWHNEHDNAEPVVIMFSPEGKVSRLRFNQTPSNSLEPIFDQAVSENLYLLVGKRENIQAPAAGADPTLAQSDYTTMGANDQQRAKLREPINWLRGESRWVVIGSLSGRIVTVENAFVDPLTVIQDPAPTINANEGTDDMRSRQILSAREFTRDMRQLGGR